MSNLLNLGLGSKSLLSLSLLTLPLLFYAFIFPKKTKLTLYVHDYHTGLDTSAAVVAGRDGPTTSVFHFGTVVAVDNPVTEGPHRTSKEIGRAQGIYVNSQLDGKGLHMVFSVIFNGGKYKGSTLEIQGSDIFEVEEREFSVVSGTGYFRFVKGYGIMTTEMMDKPNLRAIIKLHITVKHY